MLSLIAGTKTHRFEVFCDEATIARISMKSMKPFQNLNWRNIDRERGEPTILLAFFSI
jgi:hypothetical protein